MSTRRSGRLRSASHSGLTLITHARPWSTTAVTISSTSSCRSSDRSREDLLSVREQHADDYEAIRHVYAEAFRRPRFRRPQNPGSIPPEVGLFEALWEAGDAIPEFSFTALTDGGVVGHVTASQATVAAD